MLDTPIIGALPKIVLLICIQPRVFDDEALRYECIDERSTCYLSEFRSDRLIGAPCPQGFSRDTAKYLKQVYTYTLISIMFNNADSTHCPGTPINVTNNDSIRGRFERRDFWPKISDSYAMEGAANMPTCYYRSGFDIAVPLRSKKTFPLLSGVAPWNREFFLTVKV